MKRIFALTLAALLVLSLAACGGSPASVPTAGENEDTIPTDTTAPAGIIFDELSIHESDTCSILVTGIDAENPTGYILNLCLSNNTEAEEIVDIEYVYEANDEGEYEVVDEIENVELVPTNLVFVLTGAKVNGTAVDMTFTSDADSGSRNYDQLVFDAALKDTLGDFTEIELSFRVYDTANPDVDVAVATGTVFPYGVPSTEVE